MSAFCGERRYRRWIGNRNDLLRHSVDVLPCFDTRLRKFESSSIRFHPVLFFKKRYVITPIVSIIEHRIRTIGTVFDLCCNGIRIRHKEVIARIRESIWRSGCKPIGPSYLISNSHVLPASLLV